MEGIAIDILLTASKCYESVRAGERQDEMKANRRKMSDSCGLRSLGLWPALQPLEDMLGTKGHCLASAGPLVKDHRAVYI